MNFLNAIGLGGKPEPAPYAPPQLPADEPEAQGDPEPAPTNATPAQNTPGSPPTNPTPAGRGGTKRVGVAKRPGQGGRGAASPAQPSPAASTTSPRGSAPNSPAPTRGGLNTIPLPEPEVEPVEPADPVPDPVEPIETQPEPTPEKQPEPEPVVADPAPEEEPQQAPAPTPAAPAEKPEATPAPAPAQTTAPASPASEERRRPGTGVGTRKKLIANRPGQGGAPVDAEEPGPTSIKPGPSKPAAAVTPAASKEKLTSSDDKPAPSKPTSKPAAEPESSPKAQAEKAASPATTKAQPEKAVSPKNIPSEPPKKKISAQRGAGTQPKKRTPENELDEAVIQERLAFIEEERIKNKQSIDGLEKQQEEIGATRQDLYNKLHEFEEEKQQLSQLQEEACTAEKYDEAQEIDSKIEEIKQKAKDTHQQIIDQSNEWVKQEKEKEVALETCIKTFEEANQYFIKLTTHTKTVKSEIQKKIDELMVELNKQQEIEDRILKLAETCNTEITGFKDQATECEKNRKDQTDDLDAQIQERNQIEELCAEVDFFTSEIESASSKESSLKKEIRKIDEEIRVITDETLPALEAKKKAAAAAKNFRLAGTISGEMKQEEEQIESLNERKAKKEKELKSGSNSSYQNDLDEARQKIEKLEQQSAASLKAFIEKNAVKKEKLAVDKKDEATKEKEENVKAEDKGEDVKAEKKETNGKVEVTKKKTTAKDTKKPVEPEAPPAKDKKTKTVAENVTPKEEPVEAAEAGNEEPEGSGQEESDQ